MPGKERDFRGIIGGILFTFFLDKKSNKKVKAIRCGTFFRLNFSSAESPV